MKTNITAGTITRTVLLGIALINQILTTLGKPVLPLDNEVIVDTIAIGFTAITSIIAWWKNNSFTKNAIEADKKLVELKEVK